MKKLISLVLVLSVVLSCITVIADSTVSDDMQNVLIKVKQKIDVPEELTEFTPYTSQQNNKTIYSFMWQDKDGNAHIEVSADDRGRVLSYYSYDSSLKSDKKLTGWSKDEIIGFAETFLKKIAPEAFENENDRLIYDEHSWYVNNLSYQLTFRRLHNGVEVKDNSANINVRIFDDKAYVRNVYINFNYDAKFNDSVSVIDDYESKYKTAFPVELIYMDEYYSYGAKAEEDKDKVALVYRFMDNEAGYISAENGEIVTEDTSDKIYYESANGALAEDSLTTSRKEMLTEQEIKELDMIEEVISKADVEVILKKLPYVNFDKTLEFEYYNLNKNNEKYFVEVSYKNKDNRYLSVTADGTTGEILSIYNRAYHQNGKEAELTESQKADANKKIDEFLKVATGEKLKEYAKQGENATGWRVSRNYDRNVNGIRYINDSIYVELDKDANQITNYRFDFEDKNFISAENAVDSISAYDRILDIEPLKKIYIKTKDVYNLCFTVTDAIMLDAIIGERYNNGISKETSEFKYSDIKGHWAEEMINKLAEIQIGFEGEKFDPDKRITQYDLLRLFGAGIRYKSYLTQDEDSLYRDLIYEGILTENEKTPQSDVKREDAFLYMIRLCGWDNVAKLSDIYKVEYADGHKITQGKIGYPAILTGMGIICGDGGRLRPQDEITRAEAVVMLYNYMIR